ncbi:MAG: hypothetical protein PHU12_03090 [Candidatus Aenigmarchaeota archaeon]|nr:hypothetical protein [Candidatus Aenigmarchaeota archaeon]
MAEYGKKPTKRQKELLAELEALKESPFGVTLASLETIDINLGEARKYIEKMARKKGPEYDVYRERLKDIKINEQKKKERRPYPIK